MGKIEKLEPKQHGKYSGLPYSIEDLVNKINELIDELNRVKGE